MSAEVTWEAEWSIIGVTMKGIISMSTTSVRSAAAELEVVGTGVNSLLASSRGNVSVGGGTVL